MNCPNCGLKQSDPFFSSGGGTCPNCGHTFQGGNPATDHPVSRYWEDLKLLLLKPRQFFRQMPRNGGFAQPLAFALIAHWIGTAISFLWGSAFLRTGQEYFEKWASMFGNSNQIDVIRRASQWDTARHAFMTWFWGMGSVIADPFWTLASLLISSFFVFIGARIFVGAMSDAPAVASNEQHRHQVTYESAVRIMSYGAVASIFQVLPFAGRAVAYLYGLYISTIGAKEVYRVGTGRALLIVLFPQVLILLILLPLFAILFFMGLSLLGGFFSGSF